ncbi:TetR/AcrR family transcriptional regulator [Agromyces protaetiae]|uniref:TetR/AcrR family transcriptional regulator n=1 Tax=Agromyces protaetiae TaxID=2509455 RepID=A0A4P6FDL2_9MICO|nr:TetR/AcrR family transcriptional regulator [Agromyces protaetiae]QAY73975.1 TetR/AcrR family transcriptional regulator [Agromyces protaetiae]
MTDSDDRARPHAGRTAGRPRASSRRTLEDAATELFLEQGYARTTIDQIAARAGVGRNTFFNYFPGKSDLLWIDVDETLAGLDAALEAVPAVAPPVAGARDALVALAARHPHGAVPIALSQHESMQTLDEFRQAGLGRFVALATRLGEWMSHRAGLPGRDPLVAACAAAMAAALAVGAGDWALAGTERGSLAADTERVLAPIVAGFEPALAAIAGDTAMRTEPDSFPEGALDS